MCSRYLTVLLSERSCAAGFGPFFQANGLVQPDFDRSSGRTVLCSQFLTVLPEEWPCVAKFRVGEQRSTLSEPLSATFLPGARVLGTEPVIAAQKRAFMIKLTANYRSLIVFAADA